MSTDEKDRNNRRLDCFTRLGRYCRRFIITFVQRPNITVGDDGIIFIQPGDSLKRS